MKIDRPKSQQPIPEHAKKVFDGNIFDVYQWEQEMFDGKKKTFEKVKRKDSVSVIAFNAEGKIIVLNQQQPGKDAYLSLPGGVIDDGEDPLEAARRELLEETGFTSENVSLWCSGHLTSKVDWAMYLFVAKGCKEIAQQKLDGGEKIETKFVEVEEFFDLVFSQKIKSTDIIIKMLQENILVIDKKESIVRLKENFKL